MLGPEFKQTCLERGIALETELRLREAELFRKMDQYFNEDPRRHHALVDARANRHGFVQALRPDMFERPKQKI
jgi:hypothetical protein